jgi:hypothetical protein
VITRWGILPGLTWENEEDVMPDQEEQEQRTGRHAAPDGAEPHPLIDLTRDPTPGKADHAAPEED